MPTTFLDPESLSRPTAYSHVAIVEAGRQVHVSGQVALDARGQLVGKDDFAAQARQVYANLGHALAAAGSSMTNVFKVVTYVVDPTPDKIAALRAIRATLHGSGPFPASTLVGVTALASPDWMLEIEVIASV